MNQIRDLRAELYNRVTHLQSEATVSDDFEDVSTLKELRGLCDLSAYNFAEAAKQSRVMLRKIDAAIKKEAVVLAREQGERSGIFRE